MLEVVEFMSECTTIPILMDGDTGYGNFNNARRQPDSHNVGSSFGANDPRLSG